MENNRRRRRRHRDKPSAPKPTIVPSVEEPPVQGATSTVHDVPDDVLELILLRLDSSICLVRAATACKRWRRVVADPGFLERFRLLRVPLILGHYVLFRHGNPVFTPSPTPSIHSRRQSFSLDFVPEFDNNIWEIADSRGGLLLLRNRNDRIIRCGAFNPDLVVCDPRTRRYHAISMPGQLSGRDGYPDMHLGLFLLKGGATSTAGGVELSIGMSNFKVMVVLLRKRMLAPGRGVPEACVFQGSNCSWRDVRCPWTGDIDIPGVAPRFRFAGRANGSLYWAISGAGAALVLDEATAGVSLQDLPVTTQSWCELGRLRVMGSGDGTLRAVRLAANNDDLCVFARLKGAGEWVLENLVRLPRNLYNGMFGHASIVAVHETYVLVAPRHSTWLFSVDLKTMAMERVWKRNERFLSERAAYPYELPWPPILNA